jgi:hypothetical protein
MRTTAIHESLTGYMRDLPVILRAARHQSRSERQRPLINAPVEIIERARHNPHDERTAQVMKAVGDFIPTAVRVPADVAVAAA